MGSSADILGTRLCIRRQDLWIVLSNLEGRGLTGKNFGLKSLYTTWVYDHNDIFAPNEKNRPVKLVWKSGRVNISDIRSSPLFGDGT